MLGTGYMSAQNVVEGCGQIIFIFIILCYIVSTQKCINNQKISQHCVPLVIEGGTKKIRGVNNCKEKQK